MNTPRTTINQFAVADCWLLKAAMLLMALGGPAHALGDELKVKPGQWETTMTTTNSLMPEPVVNTSTVCVEDAAYDPETLLEGVERCRMTSTSVTGNTLRFAMDCSMHGADANVAGQYEVSGDQGEGDMTVSMQMGPMVMKVEMDWTSVYLGACQ